MERKLLLFLISIVALLTKCETDDKDLDIPEEPGCKIEVDLDTSNAVSKLLMLKIDYLTYTFEGGIEYGLSKDDNESDTIPLIVDFDYPGDLGNMSVHHKTNNTLIFDASVWWLAIGKIVYPKTFLPICAYKKTTNPIPLPDATRFQNSKLNYFRNTQISEYERDSIWQAVQDLSVIEQYLTSDKKIYILLYPSTFGGGGNNHPDDYYWKWFLVMQK